MTSLSLQPRFRAVSLDGLSFGQQRSESGISSIRGGGGVRDVASVDAPFDPNEASPAGALDALLRGIESFVARAFGLGASAPLDASGSRPAERREGTEGRAPKGSSVDRALELERPGHRSTPDARLEALQSSAVDVARGELARGVRADPSLGPNRGARIDAYAKDAKMPTGLAWCGYFAQYAYGQAARDVGGARTERMQLHSMQKARSYFMYRDYTNASAARNAELDVLADRQTSEGSARRYMVLEGSAGARFAKQAGRSHDTHSPKDLPLRPGDIALFSKGHIGVVESYDQATGKLTTIEGNSTGGAVRRSTYDLNDPRQGAGFEGFGRPALGDFQLPEERAETPKSATSSSSIPLAAIDDNLPAGRAHSASLGGASGSAEGSEARSFGLPARPEGARTGHELMESLRKLSPAQREAVILREIESGNVPDFLRQPKEVDVSFVDAKGARHEGRVRVMPDYLAVGSNDDFVRVPMTPKTAQAIADRFDCILPTRKLVNDIHREASVKLVPEPMTKDREKVATFEEHDRRIARQLGSREPGELVSGHKKDLVVSAQLSRHPDRVAIYGWHRTDGKPIQPLSTIHDASYVDYSHGVRLISGTMILDGREVRVADVLADPKLSGILSDEGAIMSARAAGR
ncbi:MAG: CHAP domain-containing protein [Deltaproteobacteria bacterium]|nr:CHAP domain-containing protein [Deltaproteobacteria bacterium]